jgi:SAM-dependent methyltransferase
MSRLARLVVLFAVATAILLTPACKKKTGSGVAMTLKLHLPQSSAVVLVNDEETFGTGIERKLKVRLEPGEDKLVVAARWMKNDYTKITRSRVVTAKEGEVIVDLREPSELEKDDIFIKFVSTPDDVVDAMCELAHVGKDDVVYDLGCGDGRMVRTAVKKFGAKRGVGIDIVPELIATSKQLARESGIADMVSFRIGDVLEIDDLSEATVVLIYMGDDINLRLKPVLKATLKPGSRVVSHRFLMGEDWAPDRTETVHSNAGFDCLIHLWTVKKK